MSRAHPDYEPKHCGCLPCLIRDAWRKALAERVYRGIR